MDIVETVEEMCKEIYKELGAGLIENNYQRALEYELRTKGEPYTPQQVITYTYKGQSLSFGLMDIYLPDRKLIIELKALLSGIGQKEINQINNYIKHSKDPEVRGIIINFGKRMDIIHLGAPRMEAD